MASVQHSRKRSRSEVDDEVESPRYESKALKLDFYQTVRDDPPLFSSRDLPFRASPTSIHTLSFAQCTRPRPTTLFSATGALTPESSEDEGKPRRFHLPAPAQLILQTPPRTKSSTKSSFEAFSTIREVTDVDTEMGDSPAPTNAIWSSPPPSPQLSVIKAQCVSAATPPSPSSSRMVLSTPPPPKPLRFKLQPAPRRDQIIGGRIPTPTYGYFRLDSDEEISPKTRQKSGSFLRRGPCPPSPISEDEFESPSAIAGGMFGKLNIGSPSSSRNRYTGSPLRARLGRVSEAGGEAGMRNGQKNPSSSSSGCLQG